MKIEVNVTSVLLSQYIPEILQPSQNTTTTVKHFVFLKFEVH